MAEVAERHGVAPAAVAVAWLASRPGVVGALASARTVEQLDDLLGSASVELDDRDLAALDAASAPQAS